MIVSVWVSVICPPCLLEQGASLIRASDINHFEKSQSWPLSIKLILDESFLELFIACCKCTDLRTHLLPRSFSSSDGKFWLLLFVQLFGGVFLLFCFYFESFSFLVASIGNNLHWWFGMVGVFCDNHIAMEYVTWNFHYFRSHSFFFFYFYVAKGLKTKVKCLQWKNQFRHP